MKLLLKKADVDVPNIVRQISKSNVGYARTEELEKRLEQVRRTIDRMYEDKLTGIIQEPLFVRKYREYAKQEQELQQQIGESRKTEKQVRREQLTDLRLEDIIHALSTRTVTRENLSLLFEKIIVFEPDEIRAEDRQRLGLTAENYELIKAKGGLVFLENSSVGMMAP